MFSCIKICFHSKQIANWLFFKQFFTVMGKMLYYSIFKWEETLIEGLCKIDILCKVDIFRPRLFMRLHCSLRMPYPIFTAIAKEISHMRDIFRLKNILITFYLHFFWSRQQVYLKVVVVAAVLEDYPSSSLMLLIRHLQLCHHARMILGLLQMSPGSGMD